MIVLGVESSCDETGLALYDTQRGLLAHALHSQVAMHEEYGGVVPELASRDHIRRAIPLLEHTLEQAGVALEEIDAIAYTQGPGLAGALLVGVMIESNIAAGNQKIPLDLSQLKYGCSVTDGCIDWADTETMLRAAHAELLQRP